MQKFQTCKKLGTGAFGQIYLAENRSNPNQKYAAKLQDASTKFPQLYFQAKIYKYLTSSGNVTGLPKVYAMTTEGKYNVMLMDLLGKSLQDLFVDQNKKFTLKTTLMLVEQMVDRIQYLHEKQIIHRDIKPDNFLMGINKQSHVLYVVDLGLSKKYIKDNKHIPYKQGKQLTGTARYASINTHMGIQQARRDDIQSIGYVMMYFLRGILPWQNMKAKDTKQKYNMILQKKMSTPAQMLCKGFPTELATFINYAKGLKFQQKPDYNYLRSLLNNAKKNNKIVTDYVYDWSSNNQIINSNNEKQKDSVISNNKVQKKNQNESSNKIEPPIIPQKLNSGNKNSVNISLNNINPTNSYNNKYSSSMNKYPQPNSNVLSTNGNKVLQNTTMVTNSNRNPYPGINNMSNNNNNNNTTIITAKSIRKQNSRTKISIIKK